MKYESDIIAPTVFSAEQFTTLQKERVNPDLEYSGPKYRMVRLERSTLAEVSCALADWAEANAQDEDFDEDGKLKNTSFHEDEAVSKFLASMFEVTRRNPEFTVTVRFRVTAEDDWDAKEQVENSIDGEIEYSIDEVEED
jgi:hypothetical protein